MPPPRDVGCPLCGKRFFKHSLPIHLPQCEKKRQTIEVPCPNCDKLVRQDEMREHVRRCGKRGQRFRGGPTSFGEDYDDELPCAPAGIFSDPRASPSPKTPGRPFTHRGAKIERKTPPRSAALAASCEPVSLEFAAPAGDGRLRCAVCQRGFAADRLAVHQRVCRAALAKQRTVFDSKALRAQRIVEANGADAAPRRARTARSRARSRAGGPRSPPPDPPAAPPRKSNWREESRGFQAVIRDAKRMARAQAAGVPLREIQPSRAAGAAYESMTRGFVPCPHCGRTFNEKAAERHIPKCATTLNRPKPPPRSRAF